MQAMQKQGQSILNDYMEPFPKQNETAPLKNMINLETIISFFLNKLKGLRDASQNSHVNQKNVKFLLQTKVLKLTFVCNKQAQWSGDLADQTP